MANSFSAVANYILGLFSCLPRPFMALFVVFIVLNLISMIISLIFRG